MKKLLLATIGVALVFAAAASPAVASPVQFDVPPPVAPLVDSPEEHDNPRAQDTYTRE